MLRPDGSRARGPRLAERLTEARHRHFFGRDEELQAFRQTLEAPHPERPVFYVCGPGGIGKTALLREYARLARQASRPLLQIDGREVQSSGRGILFALAQAMDLGEGEQDPLSHIGRLQGVVLIVDNFDTISSLHPWLRERLFPLLPANGILVMAGRNAPSEAWQDDPGWQELTQVLHLRNLTPEAGRAVLSARGVPAAQQAEVIGYTHGHPLALNLAAESVRRGRPAHDLATAGPDVIYPLLSRFAADAPTGQHRKALEVSAIAWRTTQPLLQAALDIDDSMALELFVWLQRLSFTERSAQGLFPHDLVREVVFEELRWRDPQALRTLVRRISAAEARRFFACQGPEQHQALWALLFVTRNHPSMRPFYDWSSLGEIYSDPARPADRDAIIAMVARHEGPESARIAAFWFSRQPQGFNILRSASGEPAGLVANIVVDANDRPAADSDPAAAALLDYVRAHGPLRPGEKVGVSRFWMGRDEYQNTTVFNMGATLATVFWMTEPHMAWSFVILRDTAFWLPTFKYVNFDHAEGADFAVGGRRYGAVGHDWRAEPRMAWWRVLGERREASLVAGPVARPERPAPLIVLSQPAFRDAVRSALRDYARPQALAANPLTRSRLVIESSSGNDTAAALRALIRSAVESLNTHPRDQKLFRALWHTYIEPEPTHEKAADLLGLPFSTYRRHLASGTEAVTSRLWQRELRGLPGNAP